MLVWLLQIPLLALIGLRLFRPRRPADQLSPRLRAGRYGQPRHSVLRVGLAVGLLSSAVLILLTALLAAAPGPHLTGQRSVPSQSPAFPTEDL